MLERIHSRLKRFPGCSSLAAPLLTVSPPACGRGRGRAAPNCLSGARLLAFTRRGGVCEAVWRAGGIRFGTFLAPFHSVRENPTLALDRDLALVDHLDRLGFDEVWVGEHHSGGMEIIASPEIFIAAAAERTRRIMLGTGVVTLPYHHPFLVAERINQLDHQTGGPDDVRRRRRGAALRRGHAGNRRGPDPRYDDRGARRHRSPARRRDGEPQDGLVRAPRGAAATRPLYPAAGRARGSVGGLAVRSARRRQIRHEPAVDRRDHPGRVRGPARDMADLRRRGEGAQPGRRPRVAGGWSDPSTSPRPASGRAPTCASGSRSGCTISPMSAICRSTPPERATSIPTSPR